jgi:3alpha(or 20beta)-hydroxysteroid dehydrogenase
VNISSIASFTGVPGIGAYSASKWAVRGITKTAALELASAGIRVNSVHPGIVATEMLIDAGMADRGIEAAKTAVPIGRAATSDDVAEMVLFLASDASDYCTGSEFVIDGGILAG